MLSVTLAAVLVPLLLKVMVAVTTLPALPFVGRSITVATSAKGVTLMLTVPVLLVGVLSGVVLVAVATLVNVLLALVLLLKDTTTVIVAVPVLKFAVVAVSAAPLVTSVRLPEGLTLALSKVAPLGNTSVTVTFAALLGPALLMPMV